MLKYLKTILPLVISFLSANCLAKESNKYLTDYQQIRAETENIIDTFDTKYQNNRNYTEKDIEFLGNELKKQMKLIKTVVTKFETDKNLELYDVEHLSNSINRAIDGLTNYYPCIPNKKELTKDKATECAYLLFDEQWDVITIKHYLNGIEYHISNN
ncbi:hypothetical protein BMT54_10375 [Pasteurellaceae bacterium 15-036681]|nr:hypothetical protein BMT54_10375 [Pasteurellaceae bacterium 15-036681]